MSLFADRYGPWAIVAGASNGIGAAFARSIAARGCNVVLVSRDGVALRAVAADIEKSCGVKTSTLAVDLTDEDVMERVASATAGLDIGLMVYNAGATHGASRFLDRSVEDHLYLVRLNCRGPVLWCHHFGRRLRARGRGGIVLMASLSGLVGSGLVATYSASKGFDINLAEGLSVELAPAGVDVLGVVAGLTRTPAMLHSGVKLEGFPLMEPDEVAEGALEALGRGESLWAAGPNQERYDALRSLPRAEAVDQMTQGAAFLYSIPWP